MADIVLHHTDALAQGDQLRALASAPGVRLSRIDAPAYLGRTGHLLGLGDGLARLYATLPSPVMRADMLRAAILYAEGGVYLDLDTITVASLLPLLQAKVFLGSELIVWPDRVRRSRSPAVWAKHLALDLVRKLCGVPHGWTLFRHVERFYPCSVNNAVMGAVQHSAFFAGMLRAMVAGPHDTASRYALGPHLLQTLVAGYHGDDLVIHAPSVFYPLAPEISRHWFRVGGRVSLGGVLSADTLIVHWYASVRTAELVARITPDEVRRKRHRQLYSALVCSCVASLPADTGQPDDLLGRARLQDGPDLPTQVETVPSRIELQPP